MHGRAGGSGDPPPLSAGGPPLRPGGTRPPAHAARQPRPDRAGRGRGPRGPCGEPQPPHRHARGGRGWPRDARSRAGLRPLPGPPRMVRLRPDHPRLQQVLHLLRGPADPRGRSASPARPHRRGVPATRRSGRDRGHPARADRQPLPLRAWPGGHRRRPGGPAGRPRTRRLPSAGRGGPAGHHLRGPAASDPRGGALAAADPLRHELSEGPRRRSVRLPRRESADLPLPAHARPVRIGPDPAAHEPRLLGVGVPRDGRSGDRAASGRDHRRRRDRGIPGRDRRGLRGDRVAAAAGAVQEQLHLQVLAPPGHHRLRATSRRRARRGEAASQQPPARGAGGGQPPCPRVLGGTDGAGACGSGGVGSSHPFLAECRRRCGGWGGTAVGA